QGQQWRRLTATAVADEKSNIVREFTLQVPLTESKYTVVYTLDRRKLDEEIVQLKTGEIDYKLKGPNVTLRAPPNDPLGELKPIRQEPKDKVDEFKPAEGNAQ